MIVRLKRSSFDSRGSTTDRSVTRGINRLTPISVAFSTSQSNRSPFGYRRGERQRAGRALFRDRLTCRDQLDPVLADRHDLSRCRKPFAIKEFHEISHAVPAHAGQVPRFIARKPITAVAGWIRAIEPDGHGAAP